MELIVACATDDGRTLTSVYFGSARTYAIYKLDETALHQGEARGFLLLS